MGKGNHSLSNLLTPLISFVLGLGESRVPAEFLEDNSRYANILSVPLGLKPFLRLNFMPLALILLAYNSLNIS